VVDKVGNMVVAAVDVVVVDVVVGENIDQHVGNIEDIRDGNCSSSFDEGYRECNGQWLEIVAGVLAIVDVELAIVDGGDGQPNDVVDNTDGSMRYNENY